MAQPADLCARPNRATRVNWCGGWGCCFGAVNLVLLAIGLAATQPRRATNWNLLFALLGFVVYYNVINLSQAWVSGGKWALGPAMAAAHGGAFVLALTLIWWRDHGTVWQPLWARRATT